MKIKGHNILIVLKMRLLRCLKNEFASWSVMTFFIFVISLNFYINVWQQDAGFQHRGSKYVWISNSEMQTKHLNQTTGVQFQNLSTNNFTVKNYLDAPLTIRQQTTPSMPKDTRVWRSLDYFNDDRIVAQMKFKPVSVNDRENMRQTIPVKTILLYNGYKDWGVKPGQQTFVDQKCPVSACALTDSRRAGPSADAILFRQQPYFPWFRRPPGQIWILYLLEAPYFTPNLQRFNGHFNWTASYRHDSDIVAPYEKFVKHNTQFSHALAPHSKNYAEGKTKKVAWFVSNCHATNLRMEYAKELSKYIQVDIFGKCGDKQCPRGKDSCSEMLNTDYKFYLSFENSNCRDYITEKFFHTGLQHNIIPIVMGAAPEDYRRVAPHYSFIHVDEYTSPKQLAEYLVELDENDTFYNEYFTWKGTGQFINTYFWCRVCAMLHDTPVDTRSYGDVNKWWRGRDVCIGKHRWGQHSDRGRYISDYYKK